MIEERIGEVRVRVRTDVPDAAMVRAAAERLVRAALERCAALLEERAPGRIVLIRRLPLRWRIDESTVDEPERIEELARSAVDAIDRIAIPSSQASKLSGASSSDFAVVFDDEAHLRASHLLAIARGQPAWLEGALDEADARDPLAALAAPDRRALAEATLARLARDGVLVEVLASQPAAVVAVLASALGCTGRADTAMREPADPFATANLAATAARWPALTPPAKALALRVHAAALMEAPLDGPVTAALADAASRVAPAIEDAAPATEASAKESPPRADETDSAAELDSRTVTTRCAGLFYLIDRIQELHLGESLWKACLPEGAFLAAAAAALLGSRFRGDAAPALLGGVRRVRCPKVAADQQSEVAIATCTALAAALPRRGLADIPRVSIRLVEHATGRLLTAAAEGSPFAFFAWPATSAQAVETGLTAFLEAWPQRGSLDGSPILAALDTTGRLRERVEAPVPTLLLPEAASPEAAALLAIAAGAPALLFAARAGAGEPLSVSAFVDRYLARPGRIRLVGQQMDVVLDSDHVDVDLRRAALDRNPGWAPWLRRTVRFTFEERTDDGDQSQ